MQLICWCDDGALNKQQWEPSLSYGCLFCVWVFTTYLSPHGACEEIHFGLVTCSIITDKVINVVLIPHCFCIFMTSIFDWLHLWPWKHANANLHLMQHLLMPELLSLDSRLCFFHSSVDISDSSLGEGEPLWDSGPRWGEGSNPVGAIWWWRAVLTDKEVPPSCAYCHVRLPSIAT